MYKKSALALVVCALVGVVLASMLHADNSTPVPVPPQPPRPVPGRRIAAPPSERPLLGSQRTRLQMDVFELQCPAAGLARLDLDKVAAGTCAEVLERLTELGQARLLHRLDTQTANGKLSIRSGCRVPVVQDFVVGKDGMPTPSVNYQETGLTVDVVCQWSEDNDEVAVADVMCEIQWSDVTFSNVEVSKGVKLPVFGQFRFCQPLRLRSGESVVQLVNQPPLPNDDKANSTVGLVRFTVEQLKE